MAVAAWPVAWRHGLPFPDEPTVVVGYSHLVNLLEMGDISLVPEGSKRRYEVRPLLDGIETAQRRETKKDDLAGYPERPAPSLAPPPVDTGKPVWWQIGGSFVGAAVVIIGALGGVAWLVGGASLSVVVIGTVLALCLVGVFVALFTGQLSERNAMALIRDVLSRLHLVGRPTSG